MIPKCREAACAAALSAGRALGSPSVKTRQQNDVFLTGAKRRVSFPRLPATTTSSHRAGNSGGHAGSCRRQPRLGGAQGTGGHDPQPSDPDRHPRPVKRHRKLSHFRHRKLSHPWAVAGCRYRSDSALAAAVVFLLVHGFVAGYWVVSVVGAGGVVLAVSLSPPW